VTPAVEGPIYVDSSVLVAGLTSDDPRRESVLAWLDRHLTEMVTSAITEVEVHRALLRRGAPTASKRAADRMLSTYEVTELTPLIRRRAATLHPTTLRTLDAIHVATALAAAVGEFATLDTRQRYAAEEAFLKIAEIA
jgi:predicted nucleic acid-binding protein